MFGIDLPSPKLFASLIAYEFWWQSWGLSETKVAQSFPKARSRRFLSTRPGEYFCAFEVETMPLGIRSCFLETSDDVRGFSRVFRWFFVDFSKGPSEKMIFFHFSRLLLMLSAPSSEATAARPLDPRRSAYLRSKGIHQAHRL